MIEILQFVFSSFWVFIGTLMLLALVVQGVVAFASIFVNQK